MNKYVTLFPSSLEGKVTIPPSKSISHRALIAAALSNGKSIIENVLESKDIEATINALNSIGAKIKRFGKDVHVEGVRKIKSPNKEVYCNESGSTLRFLIPILSLCDKEVIFTGEKSLISRPQNVYEQIFKDDNIYFSKTDTKIVVNGSIKARKYYVQGHISSQFITGLLFSLPLLSTDSHIYFTTPLESKGYVDLTIAVLEKFGVEIQEVQDGYYIPGNQEYTPTNYTVESDYSQAAFFLVAGILNGRIKASGLNLTSLQGDLGIVEIIKAVKGHIIFAENGFITAKSETSSTVVDISNSPDLGPIVGLLLSVSKGRSRIINAERLRYKESDRIESTLTTLNKLGANVSDSNDSLIINGRKSLQGGVTIDPFNDHRIAMMAAVAVNICNNPITIINPECVTKSYPEFFKDMASLGQKMEWSDQLD